LMSSRSKRFSNASAPLMPIKAMPSLFFGLFIVYLQKLGTGVR
jgi:hypothetical protein